MALGPEETFLWLTGVEASLWMLLSSAESVIWAWSRSMPELWVETELWPERDFRRRRLTIFGLLLLLVFW